MQDFFKQQSEWLKSWQESQETLTKQYAELSGEWLETIRGNKMNPPDFFEGWFNSQSDLEEQFRDFTRSMNEMIGKFGGGKISPDLMRFMNFAFFEEFYRNWLSTLELPGGLKNPLGMDGGWQQATSFLQSFLEKENPFFSSFSHGGLTDHLSRIFATLQGTLGKEGTAFSEIISSYQEIFNQAFNSATAQGVEKLAEGFEAWTKEMEKHLLAPKMGINRELSHDIAQLLVMSQNYLQTYLKMTQLIEATSRKAGTRLQAKLSELALNNKPVSKFADLCALWAVENEAVFLQVMGTDEFARLQGEFINAGNRLKIQANKLAEKVLEPTPIALKRDLDLAIAEIHHLKQEMRTFRNELRERVKEVQAARTAQTAAEDETNRVKAAKVAAQDEVRKAKAAVKAAEAAAQAEAKKAKTATDELAKRLKADHKNVRVVAGRDATTKSKNV